MIAAPDSVNRFANKNGILREQRLATLLLSTFEILIKWWARRDSNPQPSGYEPPALTIELQALPEGERRGAMVRRVARWL